MNTPRTNEALAALLERDGELSEENAPEVLVKLCKELEAELERIRLVARMLADSPISLGRQMIEWEHKTRSKKAGLMDLFGITPETPETDALHLKQGLSHAEYRKHAQKLERERNEIRVRAEYEFNLRKKYELIVEKAASLVKFWEEQGGGNGVMARAKEDALILACGSLCNDQVEARDQ